MGVRVGIELLEVGFFNRMQQKTHILWLSMGVEVEGCNARWILGRENVLVDHQRGSPPPMVPTV